MTSHRDNLPSAEDVLEYWFGTLDDLGRADQAHVERWWSHRPEIDTEILQRFSTLHAAAMRGERDAWLDTPRGRLAYIIVLDQFSRNMFRGTADMFASDERALAAALSGIDAGMDRQLRFDERNTFYMPLMHSERIELQQRCLQLYRDYGDEVSPTARASLLSRIGFAERHRDIVRKFGRFPHRNASLGRVSTPEELDFLDGPGSRF
jgi:uncharacterized protein (DUF924 family)